MIISMSTAPSMSASLEMSPFSAAALNMSDQPFADVGIERLGYARDLRVAPGLRHDFGAQLDLLDRADGEVVMRHAFEHGEQALRQVGPRELLRHLGAVALGDAGDERLLGGK